LSSNYRIVVDQDAFVSATDDSKTAQFSASFSTVTPGNFASNGVKTIQALSNPSQKMNANGTLSGNDRWWFDVEGIGNTLGSMTQLGDLSDKSYALVAKNYAQRAGGFISADAGGFDGIELQETHVGFFKFGVDDQIYIDSQVNDIDLQRFDHLYNNLGYATDNQNHLINQHMVAFGNAVLNNNNKPNLAGQSFIGLVLAAEADDEFTRINYLYRSPDDPNARSLEQVTGNSYPVIMA
jgi:hypothetical protein